MRLTLIMGHSEGLAATGPRAAKAFAGWNGLSTATMRIPAGAAKAGGSRWGATSSVRLRSDPLLQERADARDRMLAFRQNARVEMPGMRHARPHLDLDLASRRAQLVRHPHGIVAQDFVAADMDQRRRQAGRIAVKRRGVLMARVGTGRGISRRSVMRSGARDNSSPISSCSTP